MAAVVSYKSSSSSKLAQLPAWDSILLTEDFTPLYGKLREYVRGFAWSIYNFLMDCKHASATVQELCEFFSIGDKRVKRCIEEMERKRMIVGRYVVKAGIRCKVYDLLPVSQWLREPNDVQQNESSSHDDECSNPATDSPSHDDESSATDRPTTTSEPPVVVQGREVEPANRCLDISPAAIRKKKERKNTYSEREGEPTSPGKGRSISRADAYDRADDIAANFNLKGTWMIKKFFNPFCVERWHKGHFCFLQPFSDWLRERRNNEVDGRRIEFTEGQLERLYSQFLKQWTEQKTA